MKYSVKELSDITIQVADFKSDNGIVQETQMMFHIEDRQVAFESQYQTLLNAINIIKSDPKYTGYIPVFARCFMSDANNQQHIVAAQLNAALGCTISYVTQAPLNGSKLALWLQLQSTANCYYNDGIFHYEHNGYKHYRTVFSESSNANSFVQTKNILEHFENELEKRNCNIYSNCIRTWFFVRDIDANYSGLVEARKEFFNQYGLTAESHYIASTGIEGKGADTCTKVIFDAHCIDGLKINQIKYLYAKNHLSSTSEYGVTFERGVSIDYGDRRQVYISGTASIDKLGNIVHVGNVVSQAQHAYKNIEALLNESDCTFQDVSMMIIYLRDPADYMLIKNLFAHKFPYIPIQIVLAPVCRPGWLIELECIAEKSINNPEFMNY